MKKGRSLGGGGGGSIYIYVFVFCTNKIPGNNKILIQARGAH